jgi:hypothetical protein
MSIMLDGIRAASKRRCTGSHIGYDLESDYENTISVDYRALLLDWDGHRKGKEDVVVGLREAGKAMSILAHEIFQS